MKIKRLGLKISIIVAIMIAIIVVTNTIIVSIGSDKLILDLTTKEAESSNLSFVTAISNMQRDAYSTARIIASSNNVIDSILRNDETALKTALLQYGETLDTVMITDTTGTVLMRMHNDQRGDSVIGQAIVANTLSTQQGVGTIAKGATVGLATRGSAAILDFEGNLIGAVVCGHDLSLPKYVDDAKAFSGSECTIFDGDIRLSTTLFDETGNRLIGTQAHEDVVETVINQRKTYGAQINLFGHEYYSYYTPLIIDDNVIGMLFTGVLIDNALVEQSSLMSMVIIAGVICAVVFIALVFVFSNFAVTIPLRKIAVFAKRIEVGDLGISTASASVIDVHSADEVGEMARALENAYANLRGYVDEIQDRMEKLAVGDLTSMSTYDFRGDFVLIKDSMNKIVGDLNNLFAEINNSASQVSSGAKQVADGSQMLAQGSTEQAASVEQISSSISEIYDMAKLNTQNSTEALSEVQEAAELMGICMEQMDNMLKAMRMIDEKSQNISKTTKVIDDIAFQTNILALNAAVEAARAGQHGKGFAVVAEEVRNLASKSAEAAKETGTLIESSSQSVAEGSKIVGEVNESLQTIAVLAQRNASKIADVNSISLQQSGAMEQINNGIDQVAQVVQQNSATAEESAAASEEMSGQSDVLQGLIAQFKLVAANAYRTLPAAAPSTRNNYALPDSNSFGKY